MTLSPAHINAAWGWTGLEAAEVLHRNAFANVIVSDSDGALWRITPEDLSCVQLPLPVIPWEAPDFRKDWEMAPLLRRAETALGPVPEGHSYHFVIPAPLGGDYSEANMAVSTLHSIHTLAGALAQQLDALPDGTEVQLAVLP